MAAITKDMRYRLPLLNMLRNRMVLRLLSNTGRIVSISAAGNAIVMVLLIPCVTVHASLITIPTSILLM